MKYIKISSLLIAGVLILSACTQNAENVGANFFDGYGYICCSALLVNLFLSLKYKSKFKLCILINSTFFIALSNISIWNDGIYTDMYNLSGSSLGMAVNILNIILFGIIIVLQGFKN